jgi:hypothetical protein
MHSLSMVSKLGVGNDALDCLCNTQNDSLATLLARLEGILGPVPRRLLREGRYSHRFYTRSGALFERSTRTVILASSISGHHNYVMRSEHPMQKQ